MSDQNTEENNENIPPTQEELNKRREAIRSIVDEKNKYFEEILNKAKD